MRAPFKAGPFRMQITDAKRSTWTIWRDGTVDAIDILVDELNQFGRIVEKARLYRRKSARIKTERGKG